MASDVEERILKKAALSEIASDPVALSSVAWDRTHDETLPDGSVRRYGIDDETSARYPIDTVPAPEAPAPKEGDAATEPEGPVVSQVIENGVSYDVETRPDGSEWLRGKTGEISGVGIQIKSAPNTTPGESDTAPVGPRTAGKGAAKDVQAPVSTMIKRLDPGEFVQNQDGTQSSERSITVTDPKLNDGRPTNIPTIWKIGGETVQLQVGVEGQQRAIDFAIRSGESFDDFGSIDEAVTAAKTRSAAGGRGADLPFEALPQPLGPDGAEPADGVTARLVLEEANRGMLTGLDNAVDEFMKTTRLDKVAAELEKAIPLGSIPFETPETTGGKVVEGVVQGTAGMLPAAKALRALGLANTFLRWTIAGGISDFAAFSPDEPGFGELAKDIGKLDNETAEAIREVIADGLAKNANEKEVTKRLKTVGGGLLAGAVVGGIASLYRAAKALKNMSPKASRELMASLATGLAALGVTGEAEAGPAAEIIKALTAAGKALADPFFSKAGRAISTAKTKKAPGEQWLGTLKNAGVKDDELDWSGLREFLQGKKQVTQQQLLDHMRANQVEVNEVVFGGPGVTKPGQTELEAALFDEFAPQVAILQRHGISPSVDPESDVVAFIGTEDSVLQGDLLFADELLASDLNLPREVIDAAVMIENNLDDLSRRIGHQWEVFNAATGNVRHRVATEEEAIRLAEAPDPHGAILDYSRAPGSPSTGAIERPTKFSDYQKPGGENYRELVLTLPTKEASPMPPATWYEANGIDINRLSAAGRAGVAVKYNDYLVSFRARGNTFEGSHFPVKNALAHIRFNERGSAPGAEALGDIGRRIAAAHGSVEKNIASGSPTKAIQSGAITELEAAQYSHAKGWDNKYAKMPGAKGKRVLHIEEVQSDWHQQGKKKGYRQRDAAARLSSLAKITSDAVDEHLAAVERFGLDPERAANLYVTAPMNANPTGRWGDISDLLGGTQPKSAVEEAWAISNHLHQTRARKNAAFSAEETAEQSIKGAIPDAPFKNTDEWTALALKRMIRWAAENDFDAISWTTGKQQVDRYESSLRKAVDTIEWEKTDKGVQIKGMKNGDIVVDTREAENDLSDSIGKAMAKTIIDSPEQTGKIIGDLPDLDTMLKDQGWASIEDDGKVIFKDGSTARYDDRAQAIRELENSYRDDYPAKITIDDTGMATYYDRIMVKNANKIGKKFGAKVEKAAPVDAQDGAPHFRDFTATDWANLQGAEPFTDGTEPLIASARVTIDGVAFGDTMVIVDNKGVTISSEEGYEWLVSKEAMRFTPAGWDTDARNALAWVNRQWNKPGSLMWTQMQELNGSGATVAAAKPDSASHVMDITPELKKVALEEGFQMFGKVAIPIGAGGAQLAGLEQGQDQQQAPQPTDGPGRIQVAGLLDKLVKPFIGRAGRAALTEGKLKPSTSPAVQVQRTIVEETEFTKVVPVGRINTSDEAMEAFDVIAKNKEAEIDVARRGKVSLKETAAAGRKLEREVLDDMGIDDKDSVKEFMAGLASSVKSLDARVQAAREFLTASMEETVTRAQTIAKPIQDVTDGDVFKYLEQETRHTELQVLFTGARAEIGRSLGAFRNVAQAADGGSGVAALEDAARTSQVMLEGINAAGGKQGIIDRAKYLLETPPDRRGLFIKKATEERARVSDVLFEIYVNGLLSGIKTQERNLFGNALFFGWQAPERIVAAMYGKAFKLLPKSDKPFWTSPDRVEAMEAAALLHGYVESIPHALRAGWQTFKTEIPSDHLAKIESGGFKNITAKKFGLDEQSILGRFVDIAGSTIRLPGRFMISADEINKASGKQAQGRALAYRYAQQAMDEGKTTEEAAEIYADVVMGRNPAAELEKQSFADMTTFTRELGVAGKALQNARAKIPGARLVATFVRTPGNILKESVRRTPFAPIMKEVRDDLAAGGARRDLALAQISMGTAATTWAAYLSSQDIITGGGPSDPRLRRVWMQKFAPYSIDLKKLLGEKNFKELGLSGQWLPYGNIAPLSTLFGVAANTADYLKWAPEDVSGEDEDALTMRAVGATLKTVGDQTWLRGLADMAAAYKDPDRYGKNYVTRVLSNYIPFSSLSRELKNTMDPVYRSTKIEDPSDKNPATIVFGRFLNELKARTPGFSEEMPPRLTYWGEEIRAYEGSWANSFSIFALRKKEPTPIDEELLDLRYPIGMPRAEVGGVKLVPWQHHTLVMAMNEITPGQIAVASGVSEENVPEIVRNKTMREYMNWLIQTNGYRILPHSEAKISALQKVRNDYADAARKMMLTPGTKYFDSDLAAAAAMTRIGKPLGLPATQQ